tara:strand:+ start:51 stop:656 length:606 start_codon:yes stop_codon:yes gene_type:complete
MNDNGKIATEILMVLITIVTTSAIIFLLIQAGTITVKEGGEDVSLLNANFVPLGREGRLVIKDFNFCNYIDENNNCLGGGEDFLIGGDIHFQFVVESTTFNGQIMLVKNYRIKGPDGQVLLEVDEKNNFNYDLQSEESKELVTFKDYFFAGEDLPEGEYVLDLIITNPLLDKKTTLSKNFLLGEDDWIIYEEDVEEYIELE